MIKGFSLDIYDSDISFAWDSNPKEIEAFFEQAGATEEARKEAMDVLSQGDTGAMTICYSATNIIVVFKEEPTHKVVAHEIYHVAHRIMTPRLIEDQEAWAYLIGHLTEMFYGLHDETIDTEQILPTSENDE